MTVCEWSHDPTFPRHTLDRQRLVSSKPPFPVDATPDREQLLPHRPVRNESHALELCHQRSDRPSAGQVEKPRFQLQVFRPLDSHTSPATLIRHCVPREFNWLTPYIAELAGFVVEEPASAVRGHEQEEPIMTNVVHVRHACALPVGPFFTRRRDAVLGHQLPVNFVRILSHRDGPGDVELVTMPQVLHGHLLNESLDRGCFTTILHTANNFVPHAGTFTATTKRDCLRHHPESRSNLMVRPPLSHGVKGKTPAQPVGPRRSAHAQVPRRKSPQGTHSPPLVSPETRLQILLEEYRALYGLLTFRRTAMDRRLPAVGGTLG